MQIKSCFWGNISSAVLIAIFLIVALSANETFGAPMPDNQFGDLVWNDINRNGIQDNSEPGVSGITVTFGQETLGGSFLAVAVATTDANGFYSFFDYSFNASVLHYLQFQLPNSSWAFTIPNAVGSTPDNDSNVNTFVSPLVGMTDRVEVGATEINLSFDAGIYNNVSPVTEPATIMLLGFGLIGLAGFRRKFKK